LLFRKIRRLFIVKFALLAPGHNHFTEANKNTLVWFSFKNTSYTIKLEYEKKNSQFKQYLTFENIACLGRLRRAFLPQSRARDQSRRRCGWATGPCI
jgi:hypothetical protein